MTIHYAEAHLRRPRLYLPNYKGFWAQLLRLLVEERGATGTALTDFLENKLLDHVFRNTAYTPPVTVYSGLYTVAPGEAAGGTEVTGGSYTRKSLTFAAASGGSISISANCDFGTATADWGTVVAAAILDASVAGNMLAYGTLVQSKLVSNGDGFAFLATKLSVALD